MQLYIAARMSNQQVQYLVPGLMMRQMTPMTGLN